MTEVVAGRYKRVASEHAPLTLEGRQTLQELVDGVYQTFLAAVARNRNTTPTVCHEKMADGRVFLGKNAITAGLVDGISTQARLVRMLNENAASPYASMFDDIQDQLRANAAAPKLNVSPTALAKRAADLQAEAVKAGKPITNIEACRLACVEAGVPTTTN